MKRFYPGDHVRIADDLGPSMKHFPKGIDAIVVHSDSREKHYFEPGGEYALFVRGRGYSAWYYGEQLTLIERCPVNFQKVWKYVMKKFKQSPSSSPPPQ